MQLLTDYLNLRQAVHDYFGYTEDWVCIPLDDCRGYFWRVTDNEKGELQYADTEEELLSESGNYYVDEIYTQRFLPKWVYRGEDYTMVCANPGVDGNKFLKIFTNFLERPLTTKENHDS